MRQKPLLVAVIRWLDRPRHKLFEKLCEYHYGKEYRVFDFAIFEHGDNQEREDMLLGGAKYWCGRRLFISEAYRWAAKKAHALGYKYVGHAEDDCFFKEDVCERAVAAFKLPCARSIAQISVADVWETLKADKDKWFELWNRAPYASSALRFIRTDVIKEVNAFRGKVMLTDALASMQFLEAGYNLGMLTKVKVQHKRSYLARDATKVSAEEIEINLRHLEKEQWQAHIIKDPKLRRVLEKKWDKQIRLMEQRLREAKKVGPLDFTQKKLKLRK